MSGATVAQLAASAKVPERLMRQFVDDFVARGVVERVGEDRWRLTIDWARLFGAIRREDAVPLSDQEHAEVVDFCKPGPPRTVVWGDMEPAAGGERGSGADGISRSE